MTNREEIGHILTYKSNHMHLSTFIQAFHAVWVRDYDSRIELNASQLLDVMRSMFDRAAGANEENDKSDAMHVDMASEREELEGNDMLDGNDDVDRANHEEDIATTILVTCAHMASKDYEKITRSG